jgi:NAD(P)-dependent dehydrogenase (short-subunit alcohol dehydrogenase family)
MDGKVCLVTGATGGMGKVVAAELARRGATVVLVARDRAKGEATRREIVAATGNPAVEILVADLAEFAEVRRLVAEFHARHPALHVLVNNAGGFATAHRLNREGVERNLALNHFSPFLLTGLLVDPLRAGAPSRVVNVGSAAMAKTLDLDGLGAGPRPIGTRGYATAKLALLMGGYALARRLRGTGITVNALHPGLTASRIGADAVPRPLRPALALAKAAAVRLSLVATPEQGAQTTIFLATAPELASVTGRYFVGQRERPSPPASYDVDLQERLWELSSRLVGLPPGWADAGATDEAADAPEPTPPPGVLSSPPEDESIWHGAAVLAR